MKLKIICKLLIFLHIVSIDLATAYRNKFKDVCGKQKPTSRIIGGTNAESGEFPWMARIGIKYGNRRPKFFCGGSLISDKHVLTAEHCFYQVIETKQTKLLVVSLGDILETEHYFSSSDHPVVYYVSKLSPYNLIDNSEDDIALLLLSKKVKFNDWISPICLLDRISLKELIGETAVVIGYGLVDSKKNAVADTLQKTTIVIKSIKECKIFDLPIQPGQICAGHPKKDSCNGDSGGPLFKLMKINGSLRYVQLGLVSYGADYCEDTSPAVYTNVSYYIKWIDGNLNSTNQSLKRIKKG